MALLRDAIDEQVIRRGPENFGSMHFRRGKGAGVLKKSDVGIRKSNWGRRKRKVGSWNAEGGRNGLRTEEGGQIVEFRGWGLKDMIIDLYFKTEK